MSMKRNSAAVAAVVLAIILGNALAGLPGPIGYHVECTDGIDNNGDGFIDADSNECISYPWADGGGESGTSIMGYYGETSGYAFLSDYIGDYAIDPDVQANVLCSISALPDEFHEGEKERADELITLIGNINCNIAGP